MFYKEKFLDKEIIEKFKNENSLEFSIAMKEKFEF
jgi:hypothetical protein